MLTMIRRTLTATWLLPASVVLAGVGDPQVKTDHPWYPGELAVSTFERLFETQSEQFERLTGRTPSTEEDRALASWFWRNTHYWHGEEGSADLWGEGFTEGGDAKNREYWTGLFAHGFSLCGTTHAQWAAEMETLLGHNRARVAGVQGHNSFEVFLTGGPYGDGRWALMDHDLSTVVFDPQGRRLLSIAEVQADRERLVDANFRPERQHGWPVSGLHPSDGAVYRQFSTAEYLAGYAASPPKVHLRRGEVLRRYLEPGLEDGETFIFWGRNAGSSEIPGPERDRTWVNQPERFLGHPEGAGSQRGQARYANAVFTYTPDFRSGDYREGIVEEGPDHVTFGFSSPYVIAATPPNDSPWGIYELGGRNGLAVTGQTDCPVAISTDDGRSWQDAGRLPSRLDLTDAVKGRFQYQIRFGQAAEDLADSGLTITTVCQANASIMPRLTDGGSELTFQSSGLAVLSAGPQRELARTHLVDGAFDSPRVTLELATPRGEPIVSIHASAHVRSSNPPDPAIAYQIEYSTDGGQTWSPLVKDWKIERRGDEPANFWSQSFCWGQTDLAESDVSTARVRFRNDGGKHYVRAEMQVVYRVARPDSTRVALAWSDTDGEHQAEHIFPQLTDPATWNVPTGQETRTHWVEFEPIALPR